MGILSNLNARLASTSTVLIVCLYLHHLRLFLPRITSNFNRIQKNNNIVLQAPPSETAIGFEINLPRILCLSPILPKEQIEPTPMV